MVNNSESTILIVSSDDNIHRSSKIQEKWKNPLTPISGNIRGKLCFIAIYNVLFSILMMGLGTTLLIDEGIIM